MQGLESTNDMKFNKVCTVSPQMKIKSFLKRDDEYLNKREYVLSKLQRRDDIKSSGA